MVRKRVRVSSGESSMLTTAQRDALVEVISQALDDGAQIPWRNMVESSTFINLTYDTLRCEGKSVLRQLRQQGKLPKPIQSEPAKRQVDEVDETVTEPEPFEEHERVSKLEALVAQKDEIIADRNRQIKSLKEQVKELNAVINKKDEQLTEDKQQKQVESLHQCISELSAIIASKDVLLAEASAHYDTLKERIRQLVSE